MIDKRLPRKLNRSVDSRVLPKQDMSDALNVSISEDGDGNAGVIKPIKSNEPNPSSDTGSYAGTGASASFFGDRYVLGKCIDDKNNVVYYFVCDNGSGVEGETAVYKRNNGIYAYDPDNYLPFEHDPQEIVPVFWTNSNDTNGFKFLMNPLAFVKADITYIQKKITVNGKSYDESPMLFFTDGESEPYKLNVLRAIEFINTGSGTGPADVTSNIPTDQNFTTLDTKDFLYVCTITPVFPITGEWKNDETVNSNEFIGVNGCQFAYQVVYKDGNESAISTYSDVFIPPGYLAYNGVSDIDLLNQQNSIELSIPTNASISGEAEEIKILIRKGETGSWFVIDTVSPDTTDVTYNNTTINAAVPNDVQSKQFDNVPLSAETQTIIDNRLVYGNYEEGFDKVDASANIVMITVQRGEDFKTFEVEVGPSTCPSPYSVADEDPNFAGYNGAINKNAGFFIDLEEIEEDFSGGDFISFSYTVKPKKNWHIYNATYGYHASPQLGDDFEKPSQDVNQFYALEGIQNPGQNPPPGYWWMNREMSGIASGAAKYACTKNGVTSFSDSNGNISSASSRRFTWNGFNEDGNNVMNSKFTNQNRTDFGTSAGNPLIIQGGAVNVKCSFTLKFDSSKGDVATYIARILDGERPGEGGSDIGNFVEDVDATDFNDVSYSFNLGLSQGSTFAEDSELAKLVCMATNNVYSNNFSEGDSNGGEEEGGGGNAGRINARSLSNVEENFNPIDGFFLVNKATVEIGVFRDETYVEPQTFGTTTFQENRGRARERFGLYIKSIKLNEDPESILSCARRPWVGSRWWCFKAFTEVGFLQENTGAIGVNFSVRNQDVDTADKVYNNAQDVGFPLSNNVNRPVFFSAGGNVAWDTTNFRYKRLDGTYTTSTRERDLFRSEQAPSYEAAPLIGGQTVQKDSPWRRVFGGLRLAQSSATDDVDGVNSVLNLLFGERYASSKGKKVSCFSLVDGDCGPGGKNEDLPEDQSNNGITAWKNFALPRYKGSIQGQINVAIVDGEAVATSEERDVDHYEFGIDKLGSAAIIGFRGDAPQDNDGGLFSQDPNQPIIQNGLSRIGSYGPALSNSTRLGQLRATPANGATGVGQTIVFGDSNGTNVPVTPIRPGYKDPSTGQIKFSSRTAFGNFDLSFHVPGNTSANQGLIENHQEAETVTIFPTIFFDYSNETLSSSSSDQSLIAQSYVDNDTFPNLALPSLSSGVSTTQVPSIVNTSFFVTDTDSQGSRTFKAGATHPFGVVYYDERGRASNVCPIGSGYAPWYSERVDGNFGSVNAEITLLNAAPERATHFQFVYAGNTTVSRFVQYTTGGAFVTPRSSDEGLDGNIYVSLNYLQDNPISFSKSFGARSVEGASDIYTFREGDRLRIVSFFGEDDIESRVFPASVLEFNVVDQVTLSKGTDNPLYDEEQDGTFPHPAKTGSFVVLENNPNANGFSYFDVLDGENDPDTFSHNWNKRCVVEIYSPKDAADEDSLVYYETSNVYPIDQHNNLHLIQNGDVYFKRMPVNMAVFQDGFKSLVSENDEGEENSEPNLLPYFLESQVFSYKVRNADVNGKGKFKLVNPDASQIRRSASLTYSDKNNPASKILSLTSFNPSKGQFKDMPSEFGDINGLLNNDDSIFCIQSNRSSSIPVNRNLITDLGNAKSLVAAKEVLGTEQYYSGNYGCDGNQESICQIGNVIYFASKSNRQVYRFSPSNGLQVISDLGMKSFFKELFEKAEEDQQNGLGAIKVVGGYDPYKDNYILSVYNVDPAALNIFISECEEVEEETDDGGGEGGGEGEEERVIESIEFSEEAIFALEQAIRETEDFDFELVSDINLDGDALTSDLLELLSKFGQGEDNRIPVTVFASELDDSEITTASLNIKVDNVNNPSQVLLARNAAYLVYSLRQGTGSTGNNIRTDNNRDNTVTTLDLLRFIQEFGANFTGVITEDGSFVAVPLAGSGITINYQDEGDNSVQE